MALQLTVRDGTATGRVTAELVLQDVPDRISVRDLIRTRVREEVARYNLSVGKYFAGLVRPIDAEETTEGYRMKRRRSIDWEKQAKVAEEGFMANRFFLLVGDRQITELDELLNIDTETDIRFVKLVPLVGG
jgi:hypothetical protein